MRQDLHLHTNFSDGLDTPAKMAQAAYDCGLAEICFTDHVRYDSDWWPQYQRVCQQLQSEWDGRLIVCCGVEAKICDFTGKLDIPMALSSDILQIAAIHRLPIGDGKFLTRSQLREYGSKSVECWLRTMEGLGNNAAVSRIAHPFSLIPDLPLLPDVGFWREVTAIFDRATYLIEYNRKYPNDFVPSDFWQHFHNRIVVGSDSHSVEALRQIWETGSNQPM